MKKRFIASILAAVLLTLSAAVIPVSAFEDTVILGDADGDGKITINDATMIQKYLAEFDMPDSFVLRACDPDGDGNVTISDVTDIQRYLAEMDAPEGIGKPVEDEQPSEIEHKLIKSVDSYQWDFEYDDWELSQTQTFEYENGYPVLKDLLENFDDAEHITTNITYTFDGDLPLTRTEITERQDLKTTVEYSNGRMYNVKEETVSSGSYRKQMYQYGHGDEYFTMVLHDVYRPGNEYNPDVYMEEVDSVSITTENGLLKSTTNTGIYAYWGENQEKKWIRFRGVYTADYDFYGIVSLMTAELSGFGTQQQYKYKIKTENGKITEIVKYIPDDKGNWNPFNKYVFEYNDTEIGAARYAAMMNDIITAHGGNYYIFNWY